MCIEMYAKYTALLLLYYLNLDYAKYGSSCHTHKETASKRVLISSQTMKMQRYDNTSEFSHRL